MKIHKRWKLYLTALLLSLALWQAASWRSRAAQSRRLDKGLLFAYLRGPLSDYLLGANTALPSLLRGRPVRATDLSPALDYYRRASESLSSLSLSQPSGAWREAMVKLGPVHAQAVAMAAGWVSRPLLTATAQALADEEANRSLLVQAMNAMKRVAGEDLGLRQEEELELNAFVTSLKEVRQEAKKELEESPSSR